MTISLDRVPRAAWYLGGAYVLLILLVAAGAHHGLDRAGAAWLYTEPSCAARLAGARASVVFAGEVCLVYALLLGAYCTWRGRPLVGAWIVVMLLATVGMELVFKYYFVQPAPSAFLATLARPACDAAGPAYPLTVVPTPSTLPSGYATRATYVTVLLAALISGRSAWLGWLAWPLLVGTGLVLAASRVTVGWHWPSDVVAGVLLGGVAALLVIGAADWFRWLRPAAGRRPRRRPTQNDGGAPPRLAGGGSGASGSAASVSAGRASSGSRRKAAPPRRPPAPRRTPG